MTGDFHLLGQKNLGIFLFYDRYYFTIMPNVLLGPRLTKYLNHL